MDRDKFKAMSLPKKIEWFLEYYGLKLIVGAVIIGVIIAFVKSIIFPAPIEDVRVILLTDFITQEECNTYKEELENMTGKSFEIVVYSESDAYGRQAFSAKLGVDQVDLVIAPKREMELMNENGFLLSSAVIEGSDLYINIPRQAREGHALEQAIGYMTLVCGGKQNAE